MSVFNGQKYLREAIDSVLIQTYTNFEFLIINDCSTDSTLNIIISYSDNRIVLINNTKNLGLTKSLNIGLSVAKGKYIARMDADDISNMYRFEKQVNYFKKTPKLALLGTQARIINEYGELLNTSVFNKSPIDWNSVRWCCMINNPFIHSSIMIRKDIVCNKYGGYDNFFKTSQDYDLWSRIVYENLSENLDESLVDIRYHSTSISSNYSKKSMNIIAKIYKRSISNGIGVEMSEKWLRQWVIKNNPSWYSEKINLSLIEKKIEDLYSEFLINNKISDENKEILSMKHIYLLQIAYNSVVVERRKAMFLFCKIFTKEKKISFSVLLRFILKFIFGSNLIRKVSQIKLLFGLKK
jgi:glycosyltransferase involved in cell wall biosynthesis